MYRPYESAFDALNVRSLLPLGVDATIIIKVKDGNITFEYEDAQHLQYTYGILDKEDVSFIDACRHGDVAALENILQTTPDVDIHYGDDWGFRVACEGGHYDIVKLLDKASLGKININSMNDYACKIACHKGYVDIFNFVKDKVKIINLIKSYHIAIQHGQLEIVQQYAFRQFDQKKAFNVACRSGQLQIIIWLLSTYNGCFTADAFYKTAEYPDVMYWLLDYYPVDFQIDWLRLFETSIYSKDINCVMFLFEKLNNTVFITHGIIASALSTGNLEILQFIKSQTPNGTVLDKKHLDIIMGKFTYDFNDIKNIFTVYKDEIDIIPHLDRLYIAVTTTDNADYLNWLWKLSGNRCDNVDAAFDTATAHCKLHSMEWLYTLNSDVAKPPKYIKRAIDENHLNIVQFLIDKTGMDITSVYNYAREQGKRDITTWMESGWNFM